MHGVNLVMYLGHSIVSDAGIFRTPSRVSNDEHKVMIGRNRQRLSQHYFAYIVGEGVGGGISISD
jgi:hypothetical protein